MDAEVKHKHKVEMDSVDEWTSLAHGVVEEKLLTNTTGLRRRHPIGSRVPSEEEGNEGHRRLAGRSESKQNVGKRRLVRLRGRANKHAADVDGIPRVCGKTGSG